MIMSAKNKFGKLLNGLGVIFVIILIICVLPLSVPRLFGVHAYCVLTDSMAPLYEEGDLIFVQECPVESVMKGDVISYINVSDATIVTTHRVVDITKDAFITKGDANNTEDPEPVVKERLLGVPVLFIPAVGQAAMFLVSREGYAVCACVLLMSLTLIIVGDMLCPRKDKEKKQTGVKIRNTGIVLVGLGVFYLGYSLWAYLGAGRDSRKIQKTFEENVQTEINKSLSGEKPEEIAGAFEDTEPFNAMVASVASLHEGNENLVAWITIEDTPVDYPVMQGENDSYYLTHNYANEYSKFGSIYLRASNNRDFSDNLSVLYGHNFNTDIMFGSLLKYEDEHYKNEHPYIHVFTMTESVKYEVVDCYYVKPTDAVFAPIEDEADRYLVLSTCNRNGSMRFLVIGRRLDNIDKK